MGYQSKTYSLSDEVVKAIDSARERGMTPNKYLLHLLAFEQSMTTKPDEIRVELAAETVSRKPPLKPKEKK